MTKTKKSSKPKKGTMAAADRKDMVKLSIIGSLIAAIIFVLFNFSNTFFHYYATNASPLSRGIGTISLIANSLVGWAGLKWSWEGKKGLWIWILTLLAGILFSAGFDFSLPQ